MTEDNRIAVLTCARVILLQWGWTAKWSTGNDAPCNIRSAVAKACTQIFGFGNGREWNEAYLDAMHALGHYLKSGISDWEASVKAPSEVEAMLTEVINRLEDRDIPARPSRTRLSGL